MVGQLHGSQGLEPNTPTGHGDGEAPGLPQTDSTAPAGLGVRHEHSLEILTGANVHPVRLIGLSLPETRSMHLPQRFAMYRSNRRMGRHLHRAFDRQWNPDFMSRTRIDD